MAEEINQKKSFKDTLNLPHTDFPIRSNYKKTDATMLKRWENENLNNRSFEHNKGEEKFILHDGPPYANGHIHIGHAYNKILKDIVCKSQRMMGKHVPVTPGWDCHGLPIEYAVNKENPQVKGADLKKECRAYANKWIAIQKYEFKQLGVLMDWENPYLTMNFKYEAYTLNAFGILVEKGYIERKNKTVPWCISCQTVLASAEIEYQDRKDPSLYVLFELQENVSQALFPQLSNKPISLLVWTTTPWTLPLNRAVALKPNTDYVVLETENNFIIVGKSRLDEIAQLLNISNNSIAECNSEELIAVDAQVKHPFINNLYTPILVDDSVMTDDGTACVHIAPGVGPIDYEIGIKNNLEIYSPISPDGHYTNSINAIELIEMSIAHAQGWIIQKLLDNQKLLVKSSIKHSYPHCWRCRNGLIFRATKQWFCDLSRNNLKEKACEAIERITMLPAVSHNRFASTIDGRLEWCISRQRTWGVPITALICDNCDYTYINKDFIDDIANNIAKKGIEYWDTIVLEKIIPTSLICPQCAHCLRKETDILDVWFDSGISHYAVLQKNSALQYPADIYIEGKDQHRGWFQSSLLTSMAIEQTPSMKTIITHGFTVDEQGRKMSKSLGNVVSPQEVIDQLGTDGLRLWVASVDITGDAIVSKKLLQNIQEVLRRIRNTCRFLLSNINDFTITSDAISVEKMNSIDRYALQELSILHEEVMHAYVDYNFTRVFHLLGNYCTVNLSAFYLDIIKDRLYVEKKDGFQRRSAQTVCYYILDALTKLMAPILSFTAEQISDEYQKNKTDSIHLQSFPVLHNKITSQQNQENSWEILKDIRSAILKAIELQREKQIVKHSLEARITLYIDSTADFFDTINNFFMDMNKRGESTESFLKEILIVSQCVIQSDNNNVQETELKGLYASVEHAHGVKCPRCWQWDITTDSDDLCRRCEKIVK
ncbi:MAG TPA: isoleucine--tRNA ligase [Candidatus Babeliales bacterium]|nr:isoleucine--tRNA ligase [Candidatus Babeliales bacterium]